MMTRLFAFMLLLACLAVQPATAQRRQKSEDAEQLGRAIEYFTHAIEANSQYVEAYVNRGCAYELSGDVAKARADFENALTINNTYQPALEGLKRIK